MQIDFPANQESLYEVLDQSLNKIMGCVVGVLTVYDKYKIPELKVITDKLLDTGEAINTALDDFFPEPEETGRSTSTRRTKTR